MIIIQAFDRNFEFPLELLNKFYEEFKHLPGSKHREKILDIRDLISDILTDVSLDPSMLDEPDIAGQFVRAIAMREALRKLGVLYDA